LQQRPAAAVEGGEGFGLNARDAARLAGEGNLMATLDGRARDGYQWLEVAAAAGEREEGAHRVRMAGAGHAGFIGRLVRRHSGFVVGWDW
jgi:hypothetical protein